MRKAIDCARQSTDSVPLLDAWETERLEVLIGALESLESDRPGQAEAALYLLQHLVSNSHAEA